MHFSIMSKTLHVRLLAHQVHLNNLVTHNLKLKHAKCPHDPDKCVIFQMYFHV